MTTNMQSSVASFGSLILSDEERLLTRREAASYLRCTINTLEIWAAKGSGPPCRKVGGKVLYPLAGLRRFAGVEPVETRAA